MQQIQRFSFQNVATKKRDERIQTKRKSQSEKGARKKMQGYIDHYYAR